MHINFDLSLVRFTESGGEKSNGRSNVDEKINGFDCTTFLSISSSTWCVF